MNIEQSPEFQPEQGSADMSTWRRAGSVILAPLRAANRAVSGVFAELADATGRRNRYAR